MITQFLTALSLLTTHPEEEVSIFGEQELEMVATPIEGMEFSLPWQAKSLFFSEYEAGIAFDWHNTPNPRFIMILEGEFELEVRDGSKKIYRAGDVFFTDDMTGSGHRAYTHTKGRAIVVDLVSE